MRALAVLGVAVACVYGCGSDDGSSPSSSSGDGGEAGRADEANGGKADAGQSPIATAGVGDAGGAAGAGAGATTNEGGTAGAAGAAGAGPGAVEVRIVAEATHFLDYGKLRVGFEQAVDAATLTLTLTPSSPAKLAVTSISQVDATTVDATLAYYHLPRDYQLQVTGSLPDGSAFESSALLSGLNNGARAAFLSKQSGNGAFTSWADVAPADTPVAMADGVCQREADAAGLRGTFRAFFSLYGSFDAGCRALGLDGLLADKCGQAEVPVDDAPILGMNGLPVAAGATGLIDDHWAAPVSFYADGTLATPDYTWTGTIAGAKGYADDDCGGWTRTTGLGLASLYVARRLLDYDFGRSCDISASLLCLQTSGEFFGPSALHEANGKRAFVSRGKLFGTMSFDGKSAVAAADALCQSEAATASFSNADRFRAYLGTADTDALCYVLGKTGKVADHCGLAALPDTDPWRRPDNYPVGTAAELAAGKLQAPLALAADSTLMTDERPRTGTELDGSTSWNCGDWSSTGFYSLSGSPGYITGDWTSHWTTDCDSEDTSVYCFEN